MCGVQTLVGLGSLGCPVVCSGCRAVFTPVASEKDEPTVGVSSPVGKP